MADIIGLENGYYSIEIEPKHGIVRRITDRKTGFELIAEPRLSDNFRILLPIPGYECNYILGVEQKLTSCEEIPDGVKLFWKGPLKNGKGAFDLNVTLRIELVAEAIQFRCEVRNGTEYKLAEVWYAFVGGMKGLGKNEAQQQETEALMPTGNGAWSQRIFSDFGNTRGQTLGCFNVEHSFAYPHPLGMPWISLFNKKTNRAVYFAALEEAPRVKTVRFALDPGVGEKRPDGNWPRSDETGDLPTGITMNWVHVPYTKPGETFVSSSVTLQCHEGGWRESGALYRKWFDARFRAIPSGSTWIRRETTCLDAMFLLPEDNVNLTFKDIPAWARSAKDYGIRHVMISGWQIGGHDRGYPYYEPDPRLGTCDDLEKGLRACHKMGMKVSFFVNCQPVDITTEWYKKELHKYRILHPSGETYASYAWGMGTLSARNGLTAKPMVWANPVHTEYRQALIRYFKKLVEIGADGLHIDKFLMMPVPMDFNPRITWTSPDRAVPEGALKFIEEIVAEGRAINPDFCISYEGCWDRLMPYSETSGWGGADAMKSVFPQRALTDGVGQPYDYNIVNWSVLNGSNLLVGPANYTRGMDYVPMNKLCAYIGEITRIRRELFEIVSLGEILDFSEGIFKATKKLVSVAGEFAKSKDTRWSVFRDPKTGRRAIILVNLGSKPLRAEGVRFAEGKPKKCLVYQAFENAREAELPATLQVPAERVVFIVEAPSPPGAQRRRRSER